MATTPVLIQPSGELTPVDVALALVARHGHHLRLIPTTRIWLVYRQETGWRKDADLVQLQKWVLETLEFLKTDIPATIEPFRRKRYIASRQSSVRKYSSNGGLMAVLAITARNPLIRIDSSVVDVAPQLLGTPNALLDLSTGEQLNFLPGIYLTKRIDFDYDPTALCPRWTRFLQEILGDSDVINYLQEVIGYTLTGETNAHQMWLISGNGANGKSTLLAVLQKLLGRDLAQQTPESVLLGQAASGGASSELVRLEGIRCAVLTETRLGQYLNETRVKALVGADPIAARKLYQDYVEFKPQAKFFLATNNLPLVKGSDLGIWRRLVVMRFNQQFEVGADSSLEDDLNNELPGILNWAMEGAKRWYAQGKVLQTPEVLQQWTQEYRGEQDVVSTFLDECSTVVTGERLGATKLFDAYVNWSTLRGDTPLAQREFGARMKAGGRFPSRRYGKENREHYFDLALNAAHRGQQMALTQAA